MSEDNDLEAKLAEALKIAEQEKQEERKKKADIPTPEPEEELDLEPEPQRLVCPKCNKEIEFFYEKTYGWVECPICSKSVRVSEFDDFGIPEDVPLKQKTKKPEPKAEQVDDKMERRTQRMLDMLDDDEDDDELDDDEEDDYYGDDDFRERPTSTHKRKNRAPIFREETQDHWGVLKNILEDYQCNDRFIELMVKKAKRLASRGPMHPGELYQNLLNLQSGVRNKKAAKIITEDYEEALAAMFDIREESDDDGYGYKRSYPGKRGPEEDYRNRGMSYSYAPKPKDRDESENLSARDVMQIIKEEFYQREKRDKVDDLADHIKGLEKALLEKDRDKDDEKFDMLQEQLMQMQENFQQALLEIAGNKESDKQSELEFRKWQVEMEQRREQERLRWEQQRESDRQSRESQDRFFQLMLQQQQNQDIKLQQKEQIDMQREQQMLGLIVSTFNRERSEAEQRVKELTEAKKHGDYQADEIRLTADAMDKVARIIEKREPVKNLIDGLVKISRPTPLPTKQSQLPPPEPEKGATQVDIDETDDDDILSAFDDEDIVD